MKFYTNQYVIVNGSWWLGIRIALIGSILAQYIENC